MMNFAYQIDWLKVGIAVAMLLGALLHWGRQYIWDPSNTGGLMRYLIGGSSIDKSATGCTLVVLVTAILAALGSDAYSLMSPYMAISGALMAGYSIDSFFNKGMPPSALTPTQTAIVEAVPPPVPVLVPAAQIAIDAAASPATEVKP